MRDVFFLTVGRLRSPDSMVCPGVPLWSLARRPLTLTVAVVVRDDGDLVLVDAGWSAAACREPEARLGLLRSLSLGVDVRPEDALVAQLARLGFDRARVRTVIATHLHLDHVSGLVDFPGAELLTTPEEFRAFASMPRNIGYVPDNLAAAERIRLVTLRGCPRYGFPASHDLFGDGEVVLLEAPGHTRGHLAVALAAPGCLYVHVGDAVYRSWEYGPSPIGPSRLGSIVGVDRAQLRRTYAALRACAADPVRPILVPSHDEEVYATLPHEPAAGGR